MTSARATGGDGRGGEELVGLRRRRCQGEGGSRGVQRGEVSKRDVVGARRAFGGGVRRNPVGRSVLVKPLHEDLLRNLALIC